MWTVLKRTRLIYKNIDKCAGGAGTQDQAGQLKQVQSPARAGQILH